MTRLNESAVAEVALPRCNAAAAPGHASFGVAGLAEAGAGVTDPGYIDPTEVRA